MMVILTEEQTDGYSRQEMDGIGPLKQEVNRQTGEERDPDELAQNHDEANRLFRKLFGRQHRALSKHSIRRQKHSSFLVLFQRITNNVKYKQICLLIFMHILGYCITKCINRNGKTYIKS